jgi:hypothetical protein
MNVKNLFRTLAVLPALMFALTFFSCDTGGGGGNAMTALTGRIIRAEKI